MHLRKVRTSAASLIAVLTAVLSLWMPAFASADTLAPSVSVQQIMQGAPSCSPINVTNATPYIYGGALNSFEVTVSDPSYVAIGASVGSTGIPLSLMTRWAKQGNTVLLHVDTPDLPIHGTVPVSILMLSARPGMGICAATISFNLTGPAIPQAPIAQPAKSGQGSQHPGSSTSGTPATQGAATYTPAIAGSVIATPFSNFAASFTHLCSTSQGPTQLWIVLLAVYFALVLATVLTNNQTVRNSLLASYALVLVPLLALAALWLFLPECRAVPWVGVAAIIIALGGLLGIAQQRQGTDTGEPVPMLTAGAAGTPKPAIAAPAATSTIQAPAAAKPDTPPATGKK